MLPIVSVIIPCYNQEKYISETIQSVVNQTCPNVEIIVVNDGSTDETLKVLNAQQWPKTTIIDIKNSGVSVARNTGIAAAKGRYILPLDGDDLIADSYIEKAVNILENRNEVKVVTCEVSYFGKKKGIFNLPPYSLEGLMGQNLLVVTSLFRKDDFLKTQGFNDNMRAGFEDWDFWLSMLSNGGEVVKINEVLFSYRISRNSRNSSITIKKQADLRKQIYENHKELFSSHFLNPQACFEYVNLINSKEYRLGKILLSPVRMLIELLGL